MKQFFKFMFASMLAMLVTFFITMIIFVAIIGTIISSATSSSEKVVDVKDNSVLHLKFDYQINDRTSNNPFENFDFRAAKFYELNHDF